MTTLVYRDGVLAADSRCTNGGYVVPEPATKVRKLADGSLVGFCGILSECQELAEWITDPIDDRPHLDDDSGRLVHVKTDGSVWLYECKAKPFRLDPTPFYAWGSGFPAALGALHMGADAEEAVRIASLVDTSSGGPVRSVRLDPPQEPMRYRGRAFTS